MHITIILTITHLSTSLQFYNTEDAKKLQLPTRRNRFIEENDYPTPRSGQGGTGDAVAYKSQKIGIGIGKAHSTSALGV